MDALDPREQVALLKEELAKKEALIELAALKAQLQEKDSVLAAIASGSRPTSPTRRLSYVASPTSPTGGGSSLAVVPAAGAADDELALPSVDEIVGAMRSPDEVQRGEAIDLLSELVNSAYGEDGRALAQAVRDAGGIALLAWMLTDPSLRVQQQTLLILGNLCSNSFDPASEETKALLMECAARTSPAQFFGAIRRNLPRRPAPPPLQVRRRACPPRLRLFRQRGGADVRVRDAPEPVPRPRLVADRRRPRATAKD